MNNVLVISPHPDDEAIGCGGTICKHVAEGDVVEVIFLTSGEKGGHGKSEKETSMQRDKEAQHAAEILQLSSIDFWKQPDGNFKANPENVARLFEKIEEFKPSFIYVPHEDEQHPDHRAAALLVRLAVNKLPGTSLKPTILMYEVWTPIQKMDHIIDISAYVETKREAILAHKCQCDVLRFDEAIIGLNRYRGEMHSWPGGDYAEVFVELKTEEKQKIIIDKFKNQVIIKYDTNSSLYKNQKAIYSRIKHITYVPKMVFRNGEIKSNYCGETLYKLWKQKVAFSVAEKERIKAQLVEFITSLFETRIAHRDLHIGNICWDGKQIWIIDWEYACENKVDEITQHYDLTGTGLESPSETNHANILRKTYQYNCINDLINPIQISLSDF